MHGLFTELFTVPDAAPPSCVPGPVELFGARIVVFTNRIPEPLRSEHIGIGANGIFAPIGFGPAYEVGFMPSALEQHEAGSRAQQALP